MLWSACGVVWSDALAWPWAVPPKLVKLVNLVRLIIFCWGLALVSVLSFFLLKQLLFLVENKLGVRSLGNPEAHSHGAGITIVAPWVSRTMHGRRKHRQRTGILLGDQPRQPVDAGGQ